MVERGRVGCDGLGWSPGRTRPALVVLGASVSVLLLLLLSFPSKAYGATAPGLGRADTYSVLGASTVTNTGATTLSGDLGVSPGTSITGFGPGTASGTTHAGDTAAAEARTDAMSAYDDATARPATATVLPLLVDQTLTPGVYAAATTLGLGGTITFDAENDANALFIIKVGSSLTTADLSHINLIRGAQTCNVIWQVSQSATLGLSSTFTGTLIASTSITVTSGADVNGRAIALNGAVTLDTNDITTPACTAVAPTTVGPTTDPPTTVGPTTLPPTTVGPTTAPPTTEPPTTVAPTTEPPTTLPPTTVGPTTVPPTTEPPTTLPPTTVGPTTEPPTTVGPTTEPPTTVGPTTEPPTTVGPTTLPPTTLPPTTVGPTTLPPTTEPPTTLPPTTVGPTTLPPTTDPPTTLPPTTDPPTTVGPTTLPPTTVGPTTTISAPTTSGPTTTRSAATTTTSATSTTMGAEASTSTTAGAGQGGVSGESTGGAAGGAASGGRSNIDALARTGASPVLGQLVAAGAGLIALGGVALSSAHLRTNRLGRRVP